MVLSKDGVCTNHTLRGAGDLQHLLRIFPEVSSAIGPTARACSMVPLRWRGNTSHGIATAGLLLPGYISDEYMAEF